MNHKQLEALKAATQGHTPGPWAVDPVYGDITSPIGDVIFIGVEDNYLTSTQTLAAAAPDLLAEVNRLRGWLDMIAKYVSICDDTLTEKQIKDALNGAEVPE